MFVKVSSKSLSIMLLAYATPAFSSQNPQPLPQAAQTSTRAIQSPDPTLVALSPLKSRLNEQNELFRLQFEDDRRVSPEDETASGDYRDNTVLDDYSIAASMRQNATDRAYRARLAAISPQGFTEQDSFSHELLMRELDRRINDFALKNYEMPLSQMRGIHLTLADLPNAVPLDTVRHYEDYVARLHQIPIAFAQTIEVLKQGEKDGLMPPRILLQKIPAQCAGIIAEDPFLRPTTKFPASLSPYVRQRLTNEIHLIATTEVLPAYRRFEAFIADDYAPHGRTEIGLHSLPDGLRRYQSAIHEMTTTTMSPEQIQALGYREIARINGLLTDLSHKAGYTDLTSFRAELKSNPKYIPTSADQIVEDFRHYVQQMRTRLPELFLTYSDTKLVVEAAPASQPGMGTHHVDGTPDGSRPGRVVVAVSGYAHRRLISDETQAYHEGIPGHELQIPIAQHLTGLPAFRGQLRNDAYVEGWAVYAEALGKEIGFFRDPASDFGRLNLELMRAVRLVIDPGIHAQGWTRDRAVAFFRQSEAADEPTIQAEIDRYIAWPAQSLSYKIGQLKILALRHRAQGRLGPQFDIRAFHDEILNAGSLPLDMLDERVNSWLDGKAKGERAAAPVTRPG